MKMHLSYYSYVSYWSTHHPHYYHLINLPFRITPQSLRLLLRVIVVSRVALVTFSSFYSQILLTRSFKTLKTACAILTPVLQSCHGCPV